MLLCFTAQTCYTRHSGIVRGCFAFSSSLIPYIAQSEDRQVIEEDSEQIRRCFDKGMWSHFADEHAWPGSQRSLTSAFVFLLLTFPSIHGPLFDTIMFGQLVRLVANLSVHPRVGPAIACDEASVLQILKILGK